MVLRVFVLVFIVGLNVEANAQHGLGWGNRLFINGEISTITTAVPFLQIQSSPAQTGFGNINVVSPQDRPEAGFAGNPALLSTGAGYIQYSSSVAPWLRQLVPEMYLFDNSFIIGLGKRHALGVAHKYFKLNNIKFYDQFGNVIGERAKIEQSTQLNYAFLLNSHWQIGVSLKYVYSDIYKGYNSVGVRLHPGKALASDLGVVYNSGSIKLGGLQGRSTFGASINNIGNRVSYYKPRINKSFLPASLNVGILVDLSSKPKAFLVGYRYALQLHKLLVPSQPVYNTLTGDIISGKDPNVGVVKGMYQSFYDAPGEVVDKDFGEYEVVRGTRLQEELNEVVVQIGQEEYVAFASERVKINLRQGLFLESARKGARKFVTAGIGLSAFGFRVDYARYFAFGINTALAKTNFISVGYRYVFKEKIKE